MSNDNISEIQDAEPWLQFILHANGARFYEDNGIGGIVVHLPNGGKGGSYDRVAVPAEMLARVKRAVQRGETLVRDDALLTPPRRASARGRQQARKELPKRIR